MTWRSSSAAPRPDRRSAPRARRRAAAFRDEAGGHRWQRVPPEREARAACTPARSPSRCCAETDQARCASRRRSRLVLLPRHRPAAGRRASKTAIRTVLLTHRPSRAAGPSARPRARSTTTASTRWRCCARSCGRASSDWRQHAARAAASGARSSASRHARRQAPHDPVPGRHRRRSRDRAALGAAAAYLRGNWVSAGPLSLPSLPASRGEGTGSRWLARASGARVEAVVDASGGGRARRGCRSRSCRCRRGRASPARAQVGAALDQVGGERVAQLVRRDRACGCRPRPRSARAASRTPAASSPARGG